MSFGPTSTTKTAENNLGGVSGQATGLSTALAGQGQSLLGQGASTVAPATNFFTSLLSGDKAATTSALQPSSDQIRGNTQANLQAASTLMPRGGGRSGTLFNLLSSVPSQISSLFNQSRAGAASALPQIGLPQQQIGAGLFSGAGAPLNTASSASGQLGNLGQQQQQITNSLWGNLGKGLFGLATTPFGGGGAANGLLGLI